MILKESTSSATIVGDVQSDAISVDINNIDYITTLLSTNLYSRPLESFLREIVSNAWDSHVEAGNTDPILLEIGTDSEERDYCRIQDFGVGLSPDRFDNIFRFFGNSTKRTDNSQIGGFGIGRFSALAYSDSVYLTSNYDGTKYKYLMYRDGIKIKVSKLFDMPTTDPNGLEVLVYIKSGDIYKFEDAIQSQLIYFENLYISVDRYTGGSHLHDFVEKFNNLKIKRFKTFSVNTMLKNREVTLCLGKIQYPLKRYSVPNTHFNFNGDYPISINFEIGELEVTPNREEILYTNATIAKIEARLNDVQDEINDLINAYEVKDYTDLDEYIKVLNNSSLYIPLYKDGSNSIGITCSMGNRKKITYKGKWFDKNILKMYKYLYEDAYLIERSDFSFRLDSGKIYRKDASRSMSIKDLMSIYNRSKHRDDGFNTLYIANFGDLNAASKDYIRQELPYEVFFIKQGFTKRKVIRRILEKIHNITNSSIYIYNRFDYNKEQIRIVVEDILEKIDQIQEFTNGDVPEQFIEDRKAKMKAIRESSDGISATNVVNWNEEVNLYVLRESERYNHRSNIAIVGDSRRLSLDTIRRQWHNKPVIYSTKDDNILRELAWVFMRTPGTEYQKYTFVEIAPTKIEILKQFPNFINILDFMDVKYKKIRAVATAQYIKDNYPFIDSLYSISDDLGCISTKLKEVVEKTYEYMTDNSMKSYYYQTPEIIKDISKLCEDHNYYDEEMLGFVKENDKLLKDSQFITLLRSGSSLPKDVHNLVVDYILTKKLFRPNFEAVEKLRKETINNIKN